MRRRCLSLIIPAAEEDPLLLLNSPQPQQQTPGGSRRYYGRRPASAPAGSSRDVSLLRPGPALSSPESKTRLILWLLMIRSRLRELEALVVWDRARRGRRFLTIPRPLISPTLDRVLRVWMEGVVAAEVGGSGDEHAAALLSALIDLLLYEARAECDYRQLFPLLGRRITAHVLWLLSDANPLLVGDVVFASQAETAVNVLRGRRWSVTAHL